MLGLLILASAAGCRRQPAARPKAAPAPAQAIADAAAPGPAPLAGQILDNQARPVPSARVLLWTEPQADAGAPEQTIADSAGRFVFAAPRPGARQLLVEAPGFPPARLGPLPPASTPLSVRLDGAAQSLSGVVVNAGAPAAGALVLLGGETVEPQRQTQTGGDGRFTFAGLGPGVYTVRAVRASLASKSTPEIILSRAGPPPPPSRLQLEPGSTLNGRVIDDDGTPLPGSDVRIAIAADATGVMDVARVDGSGNWTCSALPAGEYRLTARHAGYLPRRIIQATLPPATGAHAPKPITLELVRGAAVAGRVVDQHGRGVAAAVVRCLAPGPIDLAVISEPLPLAAEAAAVPTSGERLVATARSALTDAGGHFVLSDLLPGKIRLDASATGRVPVRSDEIALGPGQRRDVADLVLADGLAVAGRVLDEFHSPLEGARVAVAAGPFALTDGAGQFSLSLPPGRYTLTVSAPGMRNQQLAVAATDGGAPAPLEVSLVRADAALEGLVQDSGGRPIGRALVVAWPAAPAAPASDAGAGAVAIDPRIPDGASILATTVADVGGHFRLAQLPAVPLVLEVRQSAYPSTKTAATPGTFASVVVPIPGAVAGEVHDVRSGAAVIRFRLEARGPGGRSATGSVRKGGAFSLVALFPGRWTITVDASGYESAESAVDVPASSTLGEPSVRDVRINLQPAR
ncbi:MAG TPA: carboxypeptidase-like regulatory domain-containing protein [Polyangia bacterium]